MDDRQFFGGLWGNNNVILWFIIVFLLIFWRGYGFGCVGGPGGVVCTGGPIPKEA